MPRRAESHVPRGLTAVTPYLIVDDAAAMIRFLEQAFGGETVSRFDQEDRVAHALIRLGDAHVEISDARPEWPARPGTLHHYVEDTDAAYQSAIAAGARSLHEPIDMPYGERSGGIEDPFGNHWFIATFLEELGDDELRERMAAGDGTQ